MSEIDPQLVAALAAKLLESAGVSGPSPTMAALWDHFWAARGTGHKSKRDTRGQWTRLCRYRFPDGRSLAEMRASEVPQTFVAQYREWRLNQITRRGKAPRPGTVNRETDRVRAVLNLAVRDRLIVRSPLGSVSSLRENNVRQTKIRSEAEFELLLDACDEVSDVLRPLCLSYMDAGLRRMEAIRLRWDELEAKENGGGRARLAGKRTKSNRPRSPHLTVRTFAALSSLPRVSDWVFANTRIYPGGKKTRFYGRPYSAFHMHRLFQKAVKLSGLIGIESESITFHVLRHSFAYRARRLWRWSELVIMQQGGWRTRAAFERYGIVDDEELDDAMGRAEQSIADERAAMRGGRKPPQRAGFQSVSDTPEPMPIRKNQ